MNFNEYQEIIDRLYYGDEIWIKYKDTTYFIEGFEDTENGKCTLCMFIPYSKGKGYDWKKTVDEHHFPVNDFLNAKIFDGKTFQEIAEEADWVDP